MSEHIPLSASERRVCDLFRATQLSQRDIAAILDLPAWQVSDILIAHIPCSLRDERRALVARSAQQRPRVPTPKGWQGAGKSVLLSHVVLGGVPEGMAVVHRDGDVTNCDHTNLFCVPSEQAIRIENLRYQLYIALLTLEYTDYD